MPTKENIIVPTEFLVPANELHAAIIDIPSIVSFDGSSKKYTASIDSDGVFENMKRQNLTF